MQRLPLTASGLVSSIFSRHLPAACLCLPLPLPLPLAFTATIAINTSHYLSLFFILLSYTVSNLPFSFLITALILIYFSLFHHTSPSFSALPRLFWCFCGTYIRQNTSMPQGRSRRGGNRDTAKASHPGGWSVAGYGAPPRQQPKVGDLSQFGRTSQTTPTSFGPASVFSGKEGTDSKSRDPLKSSRPPSRSEAEVKAKIEEDTKEFFRIRMLDEAESYFSSLPTEHRYWLVDALVMKSIEMKEPDVTLVGNLFVRVREKDLCSPGVFEDGFNRLAEALEDLAVDIPKAWPYFTILLKGSGLDQDEERRRQIAEKTMDPDKLNRLL
jgi:hypothetical protein